jgi:LmbE family N-acetylglucosaminyl deacetylase
MSKIIVISAHPDDIDIGMGGTVAKMADAGSGVTSVVLTDGRRSSNPFRWPEERMAEIRKQEATKAAAVLGIAEPIFFDLPDLKNRDNSCSAKVRLTDLVERLRPAEIYTLHDQLDRHPTHQLAGQIVKKAVREAAVSPLPKIWAYEVWGLFPTWDRVEYIDGQIGKKMLAIAQHKSQVATIPYSDGVIGLNRWRAAFADPHQLAPAGVFAEVFLSISI